MCCKCAPSGLFGCNWGCDLQKIYIIFHCSKTRLQILWVLRQQTKLSSVAIKWCTKVGAMGVCSAKLSHQRGSAFSGMRSKVERKGNIHSARHPMEQSEWRSRSTQQVDLSYRSRSTHPANLGHKGQWFNQNPRSTHQVDLGLKSGQEPRSTH